MSLRIITCTILLLFFISCHKDGNNRLMNEFRNLPESAGKPWCYYYWINDDISKEGITKDMQALKEAGIGTVLIGNINPAGVNGRVPLFSEEWWQTMVHAVQEGKRIGIDVGVFNCPGWSQSGGPWVTSDYAMQYITYAEAEVSGGQKSTIKLPQPAEIFRDLFTLAFPSVDDGKKSVADLSPKVSIHPTLPFPGNLCNGNFSDSVLFTDKGKIYTVEITTSKELKANTIQLYPSSPFHCLCEFYATCNGTDSLIRTFRFDRSNFSKNVGPIIKGPYSLSFPEVKASKFKLVFKNIRSAARPGGLSEIVISEKAVLEQYIEKQLGKMHPTPLPEWNSYVWEETPATAKMQSFIQNDQIIDISGKMIDDGRLEWDVPEGKWTIMRFGMTPTGVTNHPTAPQGIGYEIDKIDKEKVKFHFEKFVGELLKRIPEESKPALKYVIIDSYEVGSQNWTEGFEKRFREKVGYDPVRFFPVFSGRIVGSITESERFLWDLRRLIADNVATEYIGGLRQICNENNLKLWLENYGHWGFPSEFLKYGGQADLVSGEFWNEGTLGNIECKAASSAAHIYGKPVVSAEAFTSSHKAYLRYPALLKKRGDWCFTEGINHLVLHVYIHQPDDLRKPGINAWFGTEFNRHNTWFSVARSWTDYLRRCQLLLQQGKYAADVCYFIGEDAPIMTGGRIPELPEGYSYDYINAETILTRLKVQAGRFTLPDGMSYRVMILPPLKTMHPSLLRKLEELVSMGGIIYGQKPERSPSLENYPECDSEVSAIANRLWGSTEGETLANSYGKGMVFNGFTLNEVFSRIGLQKDVDLSGKPPVLWTHRTSPDTDIYFLTNQAEEELDFTPSFRIDGKNPEFWDPVTGEIRWVNDFTISGNRTKVPLKLMAGQSIFVVFSGSGPGRSKFSSAENFPARTLVQEIKGPWIVDFADKETGPEKPVNLTILTPWNDLQDEQIRYYSGSATYSAGFRVDELKGDKDYYINLGDVAVISRVRLNGTDIGGTWTKPHVLNTGGHLKKGDNRIEIEVANLWRNRMIREKFLPEKEKKAWWIIDDIKQDEPLQPSGLIGPVTIEMLDNQQ